MIYDVSDIIVRVRCVLDMNFEDKALLTEVDSDTLRLDDIVRSRLTEAARIVEATAPAGMLDSGRAFAGTIAWPDAIGVGMGKIHLPDDFMRLVCFKMSDWERPVTEAITDLDPLYGQQWSRYGGLRGTPQKPVVAITMQPIGQVLEFFTCKGGSGVTVQRARYIPMPCIRNEGIELCEKLVPAIVNYTGYLTALTMGQNEQAQSLLTISNELSGI